MDMIENTVTEKKPAKRKARRKARKSAAPKPIKADGIYTGMTVTDCCDACNVDGCVISGKPYCAHPRKGGLHSAEIQENDALRRLQQAKRILGKQLLEASSDA
jgi:hypothetical protein